MIRGWGAGGGGERERERETKERESQKGVIRMGRERAVRVEVEKDDDKGGIVRR